MAIRSNSNNIYAMKKAVYAILFHFTDFGNPQMRHQFCPRDFKSWCKYWALNDKNYKPSSCIPVWIKHLIEPIIKNLQSDELLTNRGGSRFIEYQVINLFSLVTPRGATMVRAERENFGIGGF